MAFYSQLTEIKAKKAVYGWKTNNAATVLELGDMLIHATGTAPYNNDELTWWYETQVSNGTFTLVVYTNDDTIAEQIRSALNDRS